MSLKNKLGYVAGLAAIAYLAGGCAAPSKTSKEAISPQEKAMQLFGDRNPRMYKAEEGIVTQIGVYEGIRTLAMLEDGDAQVKKIPQGI